MREDRFICYLVTNKVNGKKYVGITTKYLSTRWASHVHLAKHNPDRSKLARAIADLGSDAFEVQHFASARTLSDLRALEQIVVVQEQACVNGYNRYKGGGLGRGFTMPRDFGDKIRSALKGRKRPPVFGEQIKAALGGRKQSPEHAAKSRVAFLGHTHSPEARAKMRLAAQRRRERLQQGITQ